MKKVVFLISLITLLTAKVYTQYDWELVHSGALSALKDLHFVDDNKGWACGTSGYVLKTTDGGTTWNLLSLVPAQTLHEVYFINQDTGWVTGDNGIIFRTNDGGTNWVQASILSGNIFEGIHFVNSFVGWTSGHDGSNSKIFKTTDGGYTWGEQTLPTSGGGVWKIDFVDENIGWAVGTNGIFKTTNGGSLWVFQGSPFSNLIEAIHMFDENSGWVCGAEGNLAYTNNGGTTWTTVSTGSTETFWDIDFYNEFAGVVVGDNGTAYYTTNAGLNWYSSTSSFTVGYSLQGLEITPSGKIFACSDFELIVRGTPVFENDISIETYYGLDTVCANVPVDVVVSVYNAGPGNIESATFVLTYNSAPIKIFNWTGSIAANTYEYVNLGQVTVNETGYYYCAITGDSVETNNLSQKYITVIEGPSLNSDNETICLGDSVELGASGAYYYHWSGLNDSLNPMQIVKPEITSYYEVKMVADYCTVYDTVLVTVDLCSELITAISPNNDGKNDILYIDGISDKSNQVQIFNRWGDLVVSFVNYNNSSVFWDGTDALGQNVSDGTYYYIAQTDDQTIKISSWVQLIR